MSIIVKRSDGPLSSPPGDYEKCSKEEALAHQLKLIREWQPSSEVWAFRHSPLAYSVTAAITGGLISSFVRRKLKLQHYGRMAMLLPTMGVPGAFTPLLHQNLVAAPLLLQSECPICLQVRSMLIQTGMAVGYPIILASATGLFVSIGQISIRSHACSWLACYIMPLIFHLMVFQLAEKYATYRLPEFFLRAVPEFIKIARNILMYRKRHIIGLTVFNALLAGFLTDRQANALFHIARKQFDESEES